jgi:two-component system phosphate regulon sensor histidine kinase PhoR
LSYNKSALALLGAKTAEIGQHIMLLHRGEDFRRIVEGALCGEKRRQILEFGGRMCRCIADPVADERGFHGVVIVILDVTEAVGREKFRREFTANVSHELKTPLTSISGYAELIKSGIASAEDAREFSASIYDEAQRTIALVGDIIFLSTLDEEPPMEKTPINLRALCERVRARLSRAAGGKRVSITVAGDAAEVIGDAALLEAMIYNLCDNAVKYNRDGGSVELCVSAAEDGAVLRVTDTGIGIPGAERERIFERFYRVDKGRSQAVSGTGLGLAIVKHAAALHNAAISVESGDWGSTFTVKFQKEAQDNA